MPEINQPTPIKPIWPARRDESPKRRQRQPDADGDETPENQVDEHEKHKDRSKDDGHRIDEYV
ncbi:MAG: hypothetical protein C0631_08170 [Sedimenticola sp.]|jgi:hypothetical protein|nr:MAG: hypothetical protein C0631_08170 [Sedimenticola sp.]